MKMDKTISSYKSLEGEKGNKLDILSSLILKTIATLKQLDKEYNKYKEKINIYCLNSSFNQLKDLFWLKFCCQIRDYSDILKELFKIDAYKEVDEAINKTNFIKNFIGNEAYTALSITLHNHNEKSFSDKKWSNTFTIYEVMNNSLKLDILEIKKEFEMVINKFRSIDKYNCLNISLELDNNFSLFLLLELLTKN